VLIDGRSPALRGVGDLFFALRNAGAIRVSPPRCAKPLRTLQRRGENPWCTACKQRWIRCAQRQQVAPLRSGSRDHPLCSACTRPDADWHSCPVCGQPGKNPHRTMRSVHRPAAPARAARRRRRHHCCGPGIALPGACRDRTPRLAGPKRRRSCAISRTDPLPTRRSILVATDTLPARDEQPARIDRWITAGIAARRPRPLAGQRRQPVAPRGRTSPALGQEEPAHHPRRPRRQMGRPIQHHRHRDQVGTGPLAAPQRHRQTWGPARRTARAALRPRARSDQPPHR
jgi:hypothetical protein